MSALPLVVSIGAVADLAVVYDRQLRMQAAVDAAALSGVVMPGRTTTAEREAVIRMMFAANVGVAAAGSTLTISGDPTSITLKATDTYATVFLPIFGIKSLPIRVKAVVEAAPAKLDVVLVLDNSLSMDGGNRIVELRKAASAFIDQLAAIEKSEIQVAVVPFDDTVYVDAGTLSSESSISENTNFKTPANGQAGSVVDAPYSKTELREVEAGTWSGCVVDRPIPFDADGTSPTLANAATLYPRNTCKTSRLRPVRGLSADLATARTFVRSLRSNSLTNITIGLQWGLEAFSPEAPLTGANPEARRIMILMTDGRNTDSRWSTNPVKIDLRMLTACQEVKNQDIELFTINLRDGDQKKLQKCAADPAHFFQLNDASGLTPVFAEIASRISPVRLTE